MLSSWKYRKIPKISPSMDKPPKIVTQKPLCQIRPSEYKPPGGGLYLEFALEYKVKLNKEKMVNFLNTTS